MPSRHFSEQELAAVELDRAADHAAAAVETKLPVARVEDVGAGAVPARLYVPEGARDALLYLHGGGFVMGDLVSHDGFARRLAARTGWAVLMPRYRLAPEHAWPAADEDCAAAADWLAGEGFARLVVVGDSAGSALAIGEVLRHPDRYVAQVQVYPFVDPSGQSYDATPSGPGVALDLPVERCAMFWRMYLQGADPALDPALQVLDRPSLVGQPPALVQLAGLDVLTATGRRYADRLAADGVPVRTVVYPGVQHGFWRRTDTEQAGAALGDVAAFLTTL